MLQSETVQLKSSCHIQGMPLQRNIKQDHQSIKHKHSRAYIYIYIYIYTHTHTHTHTHTQVRNHNFCPQWEFLQHMAVEKLITRVSTFHQAQKLEKILKISSTNLKQRLFVYQQLRCTWKLQISVNYLIRHETITQANLIREQRNHFINANHIMQSCRSINTITSVHINKKTYTQPYKLIILQTAV